MSARQVLSVLLLAGVVALPAGAQETGSEGTEQRPQGTEKGTEEADVQALIQELGNDSYKVRLQAEKKLRAMGEKAADALKTAAEDSEDPEVQWRAKRLLRQIEGGEEGGLRRRPDRTDRPRTWNLGRPRLGLPDLDETFDRLFRDLERNFGMDIPRRRFFQDDFFQDLEQQMQDLRERMQQGLQGLPDAESRSMSMQMGPDGVRVEVKTKNEDGEVETKVYEAPDLETFRQKYPGVLENQGLGGFHFQFGRPGDRLLPRGFLAPPQVTPPDVPVPLPLAAPPEGKRLGVLVRDEEGEGLFVEEVQEGTLAERLGIEAGDVVVKIGETAIRGVGDVQDALGGIEAGETVRVEVDRDGETVVLEAEKKVSAKSGKLQKR